MVFFITCSIQYSLCANVLTNAPIIQSLLSAILHILEILVWCPRCTLFRKLLSYSTNILFQCFFSSCSCTQILPLWNLKLLSMIKLYHSLILSLQFCGLVDIDFLAEQSRSSYRSLTQHYLMSVNWAQYTVDSSMPFASHYW